MKNDPHSAEIPIKNLCVASSEEIKLQTEDLF